MFESKSGAYPKGERLKGRAWHYWQILDLAAEAFRGTQVLACLALSTVMKEKKVLKHWHQASML
jgi:hypothetical protein